MIGAHRIRRQVFEVELPSRDAAADAHEFLGRLYRDRLLPVMDRCLDELSRPGVRHQVDRVVLDLGTVRMDNLASDLVERLTEKLPIVLREQLRNSGATQDPIQIAREVLDTFLRSGALPWWVPREDPDPLESAARAVTKLDRDTLATWVRTWSSSQGSRSRLARAVPSDVIVAWIEAAWPGKDGPWPELVPALVEGLSRHTPGSMGREAIHGFVVHSMLELLSSERAPRSDRAVCLLLLQGHAQRAGVRTGTVLETMASARDVAPGQEPPGARRLHEALAQVSGTRGPTEGSGPDPAALQRCDDIPGRWGRWLRRQVKALVRAGDPLTADMLAQVDRHLHASSVEQVVARLEAWPGADARFGTDRGEPRDVNGSTLIALLDPSVTLPGREALPEQRVTDAATNTSRGPQEDADVALARERALPSESGPVPTSAAGLEVTEEPESGHHAPTLREDDVLYVGNAGLVILWPFLERLFEHLGLVNEGRFVSTRARHRAVAVLECAATGEREVAEHRTPLNKVLCGLRPEELLDVGEPLDDEEADAVDEFLTAVIAQAEILKDMSPDGLRGTFLCREGALSVRDGMWLLRVEHQTFDVVLDRLPWPRSVVKLPWMPAPCQVEW